MKPIQMEKCRTEDCKGKPQVALINSDGKPVSYICKKCGEEFYTATGGMILTRKELFERRREEQ